MDGVRRVLLVEDEVLIAMMVEYYLHEIGISDVVVAHALESGLHEARSGAFDFAVLDINLHGRRSFPIADELRRRGVPFVFSSGYGPRGVEAGYDDAIVLTKPYSVRALEDAIQRSIEHHAAR